MRKPYFGKNAKIGFIYSLSHALKQSMAFLRQLTRYEIIVSIHAQSKMIDQHYNPINQYNDANNFPHGQSIHFTYKAFCQI